jgi:hypothetical protein
MAFLQWLESTSLSIWLKESPSVWAYPTMLFVHTIGLLCAAGPSVVLDLRLLGVARRVPLVPFDRFFRVIWIGFWITAMSGAALLAADATTKLAKPVFYVKMVCVFAAIALTVVIRRRVFRGSRPDGQSIPPMGAGALLAVASIVCWLGAIAAGRFMAFF